jgi:hypothetical protein
MLQETDSRVQKDYELSWKNNIPLCNQKIIDFQKRIREAAQTVKFEKNANFLKNIIDEIIANSIDKIKNFVIEKSNNRIIQMMGNKDAVIDGIDGSIKIKNKEGISQGQSLAVAYSFLSTLFEESPYKVPFVIDSPAGSLDIKVRREVSQLIPNLFQQMVIFIISSERRGFIDGIEKFNDIKFYTIYKKPNKPGEVNLKTDKDFFLNFHSEED